MDCSLCQTETKNILPCCESPFCEECEEDLYENGEDICPFCDREIGDYFENKYDSEDVSTKEEKKSDTDEEY